MSVNDILNLAAERGVELSKAQLRNILRTAKITSAEMGRTEAYYMVCEALDALAGV